MMCLVGQGKALLGMGRALDALECARAALEHQERLRRGGEEGEGEGGGGRGGGVEGGTLEAREGVIRGSGESEKDEDIDDASSLDPVSDCLSAIRK